MNQRPLRPERTGTQSQPVAAQHLRESSSSVCTRVCTSEEQSTDQDTYDGLNYLIEAWSDLPEVVKAGIIAMVGACDE